VVRNEIVDGDVDGLLAICCYHLNKKLYIIFYVSDKVSIEAVQQIQHRPNGPMARRLTTIQFDIKRFQVRPLVRSSFLASFFPLQQAFVVVAGTKRQANYVFVLYTMIQGANNNFFYLVKHDSFVCIMSLLFIAMYRHFSCCRFYLVR
jgi:hypothetical protein